jgi:hypothetical protein
MDFTGRRLERTSVAGAPYPLSDKKPASIEALSRISSGYVARVASQSIRLETNKLSKASRLERRNRGPDLLNVHRRIWQAPPSWRTDYPMWIGLSLENLPGTTNPAHSFDEQGLAAPPDKDVAGLEGRSD